MPQLYIRNSDVVAVLRREDAERLTSLLNRAIVAGAGNDPALNADIRRELSALFELTYAEPDTD